MNPQFQLGFLSSVPRVLKLLHQMGLSVENLIFCITNLLFFLFFTSFPCLMRAFGWEFVVFFNNNLNIQLEGGQRDGDGD